jgi:hypothetical protein
MTLTCILHLTVAIVFFLIGKYSERIAWNKLIQKGIIPKPKILKNKKYVKIR